MSSHDVIPTTPGPAGQPQNTADNTIGTKPTQPIQTPPPQRRPGLWLLILTLLVILVIIIAITTSTHPLQPSTTPGALDTDDHTTNPANVSPQTFHFGDNAVLVFKAHSSNISVHTGTDNTTTIEPRNHGSYTVPNPNEVRVLYHQDQDDQGHDRLTINPDPWAKDIDFNVTIPASTALQITVDSGTLDIHGGHGVTADTQNGSITLDNLQSPINVHTNSGDVTASDITGPLTIKTENGSVRMTRVQGQVNVTAQSGDVSATSSAFKDRSTLQTQNGSVRVDCSLDPHGTYRMETFSGDVRLSLPANSAFSLDASTGSGSIQNAFVSQQTGSTPRAPLSLHTQNGSISILKTN